MGQQTDINLQERFFSAYVWLNRDRRNLRQKRLAAWLVKGLIICILDKMDMELWNCPKNFS